jgi:structural maintenance of chromosome 4
MCLRKPGKTPEDVPRLFDLLRLVDERHAGIVFNFVKEILLVRDIDQGIRICKRNENNRFRQCVTVSGEFVNGNKSISGGGSPVKGRVMLEGDKRENYDLKHT